MVMGRALLVFSSLVDAHELSTSEAKTNNAHPSDRGTYQQGAHLIGFGRDTLVLVHLGLVGSGRCSAAARQCLALGGQRHFVLLPGAFVGNGRFEFGLSRNKPRLLLRQITVHIDNVLIEARNHALDTGILGRGRLGRDALGILQLGNGVLQQLQQTRDTTWAGKVTPYDTVTRL